MRRQAVDYKRLAKKYIKDLTDLSDIFSPQQPYHFGGHAREVGNKGFEFDIKIRKHVDVPEGISDEQFMAQMGSDLDWFIKDLKQRYDWIKEVGTTGRSGGWLVIVPKSASPEEVEDTIKVMEEVVDGTANYSPSDELDDAKKVIQKLNTIQWGLAAIETDIKDSADAMFTEYEKEEFWA